MCVVSEKLYGTAGGGGIEGVEDSGFVRQSLKGSN